MEAKELRKLTASELKDRLAEQVETHFNLRFQHKTGQLEKTSRLKQVKREIARMKTIQREKDVNSR